MLTRKPRVGEILYYRDPERTLRVTRFDDNIMFYEWEKEPNGPDCLIIWRFHDGLNQLLHHVD